MDEGRLNFTFEYKSSFSSNFIVFIFFKLSGISFSILGLDINDRNIILTIIEKFQGGPVGLDTLAAAIGEDAGTIEEVYEPYLVKNGLINRTPKGRVATDLAYKHFGIPKNS